MAEDRGDREGVVLGRRRQAVAERVVLAVLVRRVVLREPRSILAPLRRRPRTVVNWPPERMPVTALAMLGFSATQRTRIGGRVDLTDPTRAESALVSILGASSPDEG